MKYCKNCGKQIEEDMTLCEECKKKDQNVFEQIGESIKKIDTESDKNNAIAVLSYLGILVLIPLILFQKNKFVRFHVNQGLVLFIFDAICSAFSFVTFFVPVVGAIISGVLGLISLILMIIGIVNACNNKMEKLPIIGGFVIIK